METTSLELWILWTGRLFFCVLSPQVQWAIRCLENLNDSTLSIGDIVYIQTHFFYFVQLSVSKGYNKLQVGCINILSRLASWMIAHFLPIKKIILDDCFIFSSEGSQGIVMPLDFIIDNYKVSRLFAFDYFFLTPEISSSPLVS